MMGQSLFGLDGIKTEALLFVLSRFLHANRFPPPLSKCGAGFRLKTLSAIRLIASAAATAGVESIGDVANEMMTSG
jgi:hypothetical protein